MDLFSKHDSERSILLEYKGDRNNNNVPDPEEIGVKYLKGDADAYDGTILFTKKKSKPVKVGEDRWVMGANIGHDSGATLVKNGKVFVSVNSERITRIKHDESNDDFHWCSLVVHCFSSVFHDKSRFQ